MIRSKAHRLLQRWKHKPRRDSTKEIGLAFERTDETFLFALTKGATRG